VQRIHCPLSNIALSPLDATPASHPVSVAYKRLTDILNPLDATLTQKPGVGAHDSGTHHSALGTHHSPLQSSPFLSHSCALFCHHEKLNSFVFSRFRTLCPKTPGVGVCPTSLFRYPPFLTSRNGYALPAAMGAAAKRAYRLQERRSCPALNQLSGGGGGGGASGPPLNL
jgi:hypothetical protein